MGYTKAQMVSQAMTPKFSAFLSFLGSTAILCEIFSDRRWFRCLRGDGGEPPPPSHNRYGNNTAIERLLVGLSISDMFFSVGWFLTTLPAPRERVAGSLWGAIGTDGTCTAQAFVISLGFWNMPVYNTFMSLYYDLIITRGWKEEQLLKIDRYVHPILWTLTLINSITLASLTLFNSYGVICYITSVPPNCSDAPDSDSPCERGNEHAWKVALFEQVFPIWPCLVLNAVFMTRIYRHVKDCIVQSQSHRFNGSTAATGPPPLTDRARRQIQSVRSQSLRYVGAMFVTLVPDAVYCTIYFTSPSREYFNFWFETVVYICLPLQGLLNFLIFIRQRGSSSTTLTPISRLLVFLFLQNPVIAAMKLMAARLNFSRRRVEVASEVIRATPARESKDGPIRTRILERATSTRTTNSTRSCNSHNTNERVMSRSSYQL